MSLNIIEDVENKIESLLFFSKEPLEISELCRFYKLNNDEMMVILESLKNRRLQSGINIRIKNEKISLVTNPFYGEDIKNFFFPDQKPKKITSSALMTLAIIAYRGPVTKATIEKIRDRSVETTLSNLLEKNLIYISGKQKSIGNPNLYDVTDDFYAYLGVSGKNELPKIEDITNSLKYIEKIDENKEKIKNNENTDEKDRKFAENKINSIEETENINNLLNENLGKMKNLDDFEKYDDYYEYDSFDDYDE